MVFLPHGISLCQLQFLHLHGDGGDIYLAGLLGVTEMRHSFGCLFMH